MREKKIKIINPDLKEDYHIHSSNYSDGENTVLEIIEQAGKMGLKKIAITDHAHKGRMPFEPRENILNFVNVINDVKVIFGLEGDILNKEGDITTEMAGVQTDFLIISFHPPHYNDDFSTVTEGIVRAIERHHDKIFCLCHLHMGDVPWTTVPDFDAKKIIETANKFNLPLEINGAYIEGKYCNKEVLDLIWELSDTIVFNTDSHSLAHMTSRHEKLRKFLEEKGYLK